MHARGAVGVRGGRTPRGAARGAGRRANTTTTMHGTSFLVSNAPPLPDGATVLLCGSDYALGCWDIHRAVTMHASGQQVSGCV